MHPQSRSKIAAQPRLIHPRVELDIFTGIERFVKQPHLGEDLPAVSHGGVLRRNEARRVGKDVRVRIVAEPTAASQSHRFLKRRRIRHFQGLRPPQAISSACGKRLDHMPQIAPVRQVAMAIHNDNVFATGALPGGIAPRRGPAPRICHQMQLSISLLPAPDDRRRPILGLSIRDDDLIPVRRVILSQQGL